MTNKKIRQAIILSLLFTTGVLVYRYEVKLIEGYNMLSGYIANPEKFKTLISSYGSRGIFIFLLFQIIQVIVAFIPGEAVQFLGGVVYGPIKGVIYSFIGIFIGEVIAFYMARLIGRAIISRFVSLNKIKKVEHQINSKKSEIIMFILFLIPGFSKDALTYFAGLTPINPTKFFIISMLGRLPALTGSIILGHSYLKGDYKSIILVIVALIIFGLMGYIAKKRLDTIKLK